jgi:hypothetical protein
VYRKEERKPVVGEACLVLGRLRRSDAQVRISAHNDDEKGEARSEEYGLAHVFLISTDRQFH